MRRCEKAFQRNTQWLMWAGERKAPCCRICYVARSFYIRSTVVTKKYSDRARGLCLQATSYSKTVSYVQVVAFSCLSGVQKGKTKPMTPTHAFLRKGKGSTRHSDVSIEKSTHGGVSSHTKRPPPRCDLFCDCSSIKPQHNNDKPTSLSSCGFSSCHSQAN